MSGHDQQHQTGRAPKKPPSAGMSQEAMNDGKGFVKSQAQQNGDRHQQEKTGKKDARRYAPVKQVDQIRQIDRINIKIEPTIEKKRYQGIAKLKES